jgi:hypothetical protein
MSAWTDFNDAEHPAFAPIPKGTLLKVRMTIRPGGFDDPTQGWTDGWATRNAESGAVYLNCEFVVLGGPYARRKLWSLIGLHSAKGPNWAQMGRAFIKGALNSAQGLHPDDVSATAQACRRIAGFGDLDGLEFVGLVDWEKDAHGQDKAVIKTPIAPDHPEYAQIMRSVPVAPAPPSSSTSPSSSTAAVPTRPSWAQ